MGSAPASGAANGAPAVRTCAYSPRGWDAPHAFCSARRRAERQPKAAALPIAKYIPDASQHHSDQSGIIWRKLTFAAAEWLEPLSKELIQFETEQLWHLARPRH